MASISWVEPERNAVGDSVSIAESHATRQLSVCQGIFEMVSDSRIVSSVTDLFWSSDIVLDLAGGCSAFEARKKPERWEEE
jgi:hypothetical protein